MKFLLLRNSYLNSVKTILFGIILSILAGMPLLSTLLPDHVDYKETTQTVKLKPGQNQIGDITKVDYDETTK